MIYETIMEKELTKKEIDKIIIDNLKLIPWTIKKMNLNYGSEEEYQTYYDDGLEGLIKAAPKYDPSSGKATTFFYPCIKNAILHGLMYKTTKKRFNPLGRDISLYKTLGDEFELEDMIKDPNINIEEEIIKKEENERLVFAINQIKNEKDKLVIKMHYGLCGYMPMTFEEISKKFGVTRSAIQNREKRCLPKLKEIYEKYERKEKMIQEDKKNISCKKDNNPLKELNNILFEQINKLNNPTNDFEKELKKAKATSNLAQQIVANMNAGIKLLSLMNEIMEQLMINLNIWDFQKNKDV